MSYYTHFACFYQETSTWYTMWNRNRIANTLSATQFNNTRTAIGFNVALLPVEATCCKGELLWHNVTEAWLHSKQWSTSRRHLLDGLSNECGPYEEGHLGWVVDCLKHFPETEKFDVLWYIACQLASIADQGPQRLYKPLQSSRPAAFLVAYVFHVVEAATLYNGIKNNFVTNCLLHCLLLSITSFLLVSFFLWYFKD